VSFAEVGHPPRRIPTPEWSPRGGSAVLPSSYFHVRFWSRRPIFGSALVGQVVRGRDCRDSPGGAPSRRLPHWRAVLVTGL